MTKQANKTFGDTIGAPAFPGVDQQKLADLIDIPITVHDARFKMMKYGEVVIVLASLPGDERRFSVLMGGEVVREKIREAMKQHLLPLDGTVSLSDGEPPYYDIA